MYQEFVLFPCCGHPLATYLDQLACWAHISYTNIVMPYLYAISCTKTLIFIYFYLILYAIFLLGRVNFDCSVFMLLWSMWLQGSYDVSGICSFSLLWLPVGYVLINWHVEHISCTQTLSCHIWHVFHLHLKCACDIAFQWNGGHAPPYCALASCCWKLYSEEVEVNQTLCRWVTSPTPFFQLSALYAEGHAQPFMKECNFLVKCASLGPQFGHSYWLPF